MSAPLLETRALSRRFGGRRRWLGADEPLIQAVSQVDLRLGRGETLGIVGESGCGKSTLARMLVGLDRPSEGEILIAGEAAEALRRRGELHRRIQYVFQDPLGSLNPRKRVRQIVEAPMRHLLDADKDTCSRRSAELMEQVGLRPEFLDRHPHELSGGQAQRVGIARALAARAELVILDEPVSALDVSIQAQVLQLLDELKRAFDLTYLFISHDLAVVEQLCQRVAVMYFGRIVEQAPRAALFAAPRHPYTRLLLDSVPVPGRRRPPAIAGSGELPDPSRPPSGCAFRTRCPRADTLCAERRPPPQGANGHTWACHHPLDAGGNI